MRIVFIDTNYFVALLHPDDQWHERAIEVESQLGVVEAVTTETVLIEVLNYFSKFRPFWRQLAATAVHRWLEDKRINVVHHTHDAFLDAPRFMNHDSIKVTV